MIKSFGKKMAAPHKVLSNLLLLTGILSLAGCAIGPRQLGMTPQQWETLDNTQRSQYRENYKIFKKNYAQMSSVFDGPLLHVYLATGTAKMPPDFRHNIPFETTDFYIRPGQCQNVPLESIDTDNQTVLESCYDGLNLLLDPSHYELHKRVGTARFIYNPIWKRGFTYADVASEGFVRLRHASVTIKAFSDKDKDLPQHVMSNTSVTSSVSAAPYSAAVTGSTQKKLPPLSNELPNYREAPATSKKINPPHEASSANQLPKSEINPQPIAKKPAPAQPVEPSVSDNNEDKMARVGEDPTISAGSNVDAETPPN